MAHKKPLYSPLLIMFECTLKLIEYSLSKQVFSSGGHDMLPNKASVKSTREVNSMIREPGKPFTFAISAEQRHRMISDAAYYIALGRGFQGGDPLQDWLKAEAEIDTLLIL